MASICVQHFIYRRLRFMLIKRSFSAFPCGPSADHVKHWKRAVCPSRSTCKNWLSQHTLTTKHETELSSDGRDLQHYIRKLVSEYQGTLEKFTSSSETDDKTNTSELTAMRQKLLQLKPIIECVEEMDRHKRDIEELNTLTADESIDPEMLRMAQEDKSKIADGLKSLDEKLITLILPPEPLDHSNVILEVTAGVGGQEAMLFAKELFEMYSSYVRWKGWMYSILDYQESELGGLRHASLSVEGTGVYSILKFEGGVHRVQRVPQTEKTGRVHTSTATVAIIPQPSEIEVTVNPKDLKIETKRSSGAGGQHVNKTESAVRMLHIPSGIVVECQEERSQIENREVALRKLRAKLYQKQWEHQITQHQSSRKMQVGTSGRSEKIRTYNFNQDRITDHRLGNSCHNIKEFLTGGSNLDALIQTLTQEAKQEILVEMVQLAK